MSIFTSPAVFLGVALVAVPKLGGSCGVNRGAEVAGGAVGTLDAEEAVLPPVLGVDAATLVGVLVPPVVIARLFELLLV